MSSTTSTASRSAWGLAGVEVLALGGVAVVHARVARTARSRGRGLLWSRRLEAGEGMLLSRCGSVHTWLMAYPIDVVYFDAQLRIVKVAADVRPWRFSAGGRGARHTLEMRAGEAARIGLVRGVQLEMPEGGGL